GGSRSGSVRAVREQRGGAEMILDQFRLDGKVAIVTGASRGLGQAMALGLAEAGADQLGQSVSSVEEQK
ncbi:MAG: hypothetical protein JSU61_06300, partial [Fidelibacterota bacterium]